MLFILYILSIIPAALVAGAGFDYLFSLTAQAGMPLWDANLDGVTTISDMWYFAFAPGIGLQKFLLDHESLRTFFEWHTMVPLGILSAVFSAFIWVWIAHLGRIFYLLFQLESRY